MGLVQLLNSEGFNVQLRHIADESEETRDRVTIKNSAGEELATHGDMQHNRKYYEQQANGQALCDQVKAKLAAAEKQPTTEAATTTKAAEETAAEAAEETIFTKAADAAAEASASTAEAVNA